MKYILGFSAGILVVGVPVFWYLTHNNALADYISQNFLTGSSRAFDGFSVKEFVKSFFMIMYKNFCFVPAIASFMWIVKKQKNITIFYVLGFLSAYFLTVLFLAIIRTNFDHYNMTLTPFLVPAFVFCIKLCSAYFADSRYKKNIMVCFLILVFSKELVQWVYSIYIMAGRIDKAHLELIATGKTIDRHTNPGDTIISLGFSCQIYLFTGRSSASRYIYQSSGASYDPNMQAEFLADMERHKPKIIIIRSEAGAYDYLPDWYAPVYEMLAKDYRILSDENGFFLFTRNDEG